MYTKRNGFLWKKKYKARLYLKKKLKECDTGKCFSIKINKIDVVHMKPPKIN